MPPRMPAESAWGRGMAIEIKGVEGSLHPAALARLRYDVYVREFGRRLPGCDDEQGMVVEDEDGVSTHFAAYDDGEPVACLRLTPIDALKAQSRWRGNYDIPAFPVSEQKQAVLSRLVVRADHRNTLLAPQLLAAAYEAFRAADGELLFLSCAANTVSLYEVMGFRRYMRIQGKQSRAKLELDLEPGSLLLMDYESQKHYDHGIPKERAAVGPRISLAFRMRR